MRTVFAYLVNECRGFAKLNKLKKSEKKNIA